MTRVRLPTRTPVTVIILTMDAYTIIPCTTRIDADGFAVAKAPRRNPTGGAFRLWADHEGLFWARGHDTPAAKALIAAVALATPTSSA